MQSWNHTSCFKSHLLLIWNFQMRLEMRCAIWNFWNFSNNIMEGCLFETFRWDLKWDVLFETFETFQTYHGELLIWNFQMRLEIPSQELFIWNFQMRLEWDMLFETFWNLKLFNPSQELLIWNFQMRLERDMIFETFWNWKPFQPITGVTYLKLSDVIWNEICYLKHLKCLKLETV